MLAVATLASAALASGFFSRGRSMSSFVVQAPVAGSLFEALLMSACHCPIPPCTNATAQASKAYGFFFPFEAMASSVSGERLAMSSSWL